MTMTDKQPLSIMLTQGLGNQMFQYAFMVYMAEKHNKQQIINSNFAYKIVAKGQGDFELSNFKLGDDVKISKFAFNQLTYKLYNIYFRIFVKYKKSTYREGINSNFNNGIKNIKQL